MDLYGVLQLLSIQGYSPPFQGLFVLSLILLGPFPKHPRENGEKGTRFMGIPLEP